MRRLLYVNDTMYINKSTETFLLQNQKETEHHGGVKSSAGATAHLNNALHGLRCLWVTCSGPGHGGFIPSTWLRPTLDLCSDVRLSQAWVGLCTNCPFGISIWMCIRHLTL